MYVHALYPMHALFVQHALCWHACGMWHANLDHACGKHVLTMRANIPHNHEHSWFVSDAYAEDMQMPTYASTCSRHSGKHIKYACARILRHMRVHTYSQTQADTDILEGVGRKCHNSRTCTLVPQLAHMHTSATTRAHAH